MSTIQVAFIVTFFHTLRSEIAANTQNKNEILSQKHKLHYQFETYEYTNLPFTHAESPVWDSESQTLYWVDVLNQNVYALNYTSRERRLKHIGKGEVNIVLPIAGSKRVLLGVQSFVYLLDWDETRPASLKFIAALDHGNPENVLNEGKADARGRFWGGTKGPQSGDTVLHDHAALYCLEEPLFEPRVQLKPVTISNGIAWALNNSVLYYIDSETRKIEAFDYDVVKGRISNRRTILDVGEYNFMKSDPKPIPDGMTIDREGFLWVALMFGGSIIRIDPEDRKIVEKYNLPVSRTTSVTWAGANLDELIVTTSRRNMNARELKKEPLSGSLFILYKLGTGGVPDHKLIFKNADIY